jgi:hypothetical protein
MPWRFAAPGNEIDWAAKESALKKIDAFWDAFETDAPKIAEMLRSPDSRVVDWIAEHLHPIDERIMWEFALQPNASEKWFFTITPESQHELRPLVNSMLERKRDNQYFKVVGFREPCNADELRDHFKARTGRELPELTAAVTMNDLGFLELGFYSDSFRSSKSHTDMESAFVLIELLLGQELLEKWIGVITTDPAQPSVLRGVLNLFGGKSTQSTNDRHGLDQLYGAVRASVERQLSELPDRPYYEQPQPETWELISRKNTADCTRYSWMTFLPRVAIAVSTTNFWSERYSRCGEKFCFLKTTGDPELCSSVDAREELVQAVDLALRQAKVGCTFGGGMGPDSAYVDLILSDVDAAIPILRNIAESRNLAMTSWLRFMDLEWAGEWVGMFASTPVPDNLKNGW